ncbi:tRNA wybutosine-synthesizing protein 2 homolog isoform X2 [Canis lupus baileyi]|uniref:tRNA wybutosine-synthesizing protein 2 homolog isoform X10 n=2 Tax=Canis lupus familiaris TaxID=9615 RepID=UPI0003AE49DF|nr:tRNA wybutosine-synthesizing protein 2 homolog isoform X10 [Canis lupus familiaris]XP_025306296.1 tRNA wybutosine-synthesizing protein 2 homolog isoform X2 [Canis lupus dingo]XP_038411388.1 tRNA wybutosine-synthesizing protein 2 homolog isoform X8 [Canis lupus familiaris]|eukprot:XP_005627980.1 tRNA wybutosine-synthesizing protein 2 homolog isoform X2 [Canis lupus familiaris]
MEGEAGKPAAVVAVVTEPRFTQRYREYLEKQQLLDRQHRLEKMPDGTVALPVLGEALPERHLQELRNRVAPGSTCRVTQLRDPVPSKKAQGGSPAQRLRLEVSRWVEGRGVTWSADLEADLPRSWQRHGNLLLLSEDCFQAKQWENLEPELWKTVASALGVHRVAKRGRVSPDGTRTPAVTLLLGDDGWVEHVDNGIRYKFDVTRCMFSFGNITEKLRVASLPCAGEVLVDLYAGIGYFTLPFLVHAGAAFVHASGARETMEDPNPAHPTGEILCSPRGSHRVGFGMPPLCSTWLKKVDPETQGSAFFSEHLLDWPGQEEASNGTKEKRLKGSGGSWSVCHLSPGMCTSAEGLFCEHQY